MIKKDQFIPAAASSFTLGSRPVDAPVVPTGTEFPPRIRALGSLGLLYKELSGSQPVEFWLLEILRQVASDTQTFNGTQKTTTDSEYIDFIETIKKRLFSHDSSEDAIKEKIKAVKVVRKTSFNLTECLQMTVEAKNEPYRLFLRTESTLVVDHIQYRTIVWIEAVKGGGFQICYCRRQIG